MISHTIEDLEYRLASMVGKRYCLIVGRATTAIYLILKILYPDEKGKVILPAVVCPSPANAVLYAGMTPIFCDVSLTDATIDVASCRALLERETGIVAMIPVHLYGNPADMSGLRELANDFGISVIEDFAQAQGGEYMGSPLGSWGDSSVVSFGHTKIIDIGHGGALFTDDPALAVRAAKERETLPGFNHEMSKLADQYNQLYYSLRPFWEQNELLEELLVPIPDIYKSIYLLGNNCVRPDALSDQLDSIQNVVEKRRDRALLYGKLLKHQTIVPFTPRKGYVPWRYSFRLHGVDRELILTQLREHGVDVSPWYPPIHRWYSSGRDQRTTSELNNSITIGKEVVNFWTDPSTPLERITDTCRLTLDILDQAPRTLSLAEQ